MSETDNAAWLEDRLMDIARLTHALEVNPAIDQLWQDCKARNIPQKKRTLESTVTKLRTAAAYDAAEDYQPEVRHQNQMTHRIDRYSHKATALVLLDALFKSPVGGDDLYTIETRQGEVFEWQTTHWVALTKDEIDKRVFDWLADHAFFEERQDAEWQRIPCTPNVAYTAEVIAALKKATASDSTAASGWRVESRLPDQMLAVRNGLLDLDTFELHPHSPAYWNLAFVAATWDPDAPDLTTLEAGQWLHDAVDGGAQMALMQETLGYLLSGETRAQKGFVVIGPSRSGKGTLARLIEALMPDQCVSLFSRSFDTQFGLAKLVNQAVALMPDMRVDAKTGHSLLAETLLSVIGEDQISVPRKFMSDWKGRLAVRFLIMSNDLPQLRDHTGTLATRFHYIEMPHSHLGSEDTDLFNRIQEPRAAWLKWAVAGLVRLRRNDFRFTETEQTTRILLQARMEQDPVGQWIASCVEVTGNPDDRMPMSDLFSHFQDFAESTDITTFTSAGFSKRFWARKQEGVTRCVINATEENALKKQVRGARGLRLRPSVP